MDKSGPSNKLNPVIYLLIILIGLVVATDEFIRPESTQGPSLHGMNIVWPLPDLIGASSAILIGEVGEIKHREYPGRLSRSDYTDEELNILGGDKFLDQFRTAYHEIRVAEHLKGDMPSTFLLAREDVSYHDEINLSELNSGETVLLFVRKGITSPQYKTELQESAYTAFGDNGIFDYVGNDRVYPRFPEAFYGLTPEEDGFFLDGTIRPFFSLEKLKIAIEDHPCHLEVDPCIKVPSYFTQTSVAPTSSTSTTIAP